MKTLFKNGIPFRGFSGASEEYVNFARFGRQFLATADPIDWDSNFQDNGIVGEHSGDPRFVSRLGRPMSPNAIFGRVTQERQSVASRRSEFVHAIRRKGHRPADLGSDSLHHPARQDKEHRADQ